MGAGRCRALNSISETVPKPENVAEYCYSSWAVLTFDRVACSTETARKISTAPGTLRDRTFGNGREVWGALHACKGPEGRLQTWTRVVLARALCRPGQESLMGSILYCFSLCGVTWLCARNTSTANSGDVAQQGFGGLAVFDRF